MHQHSFFTCSTIGCDTTSRLYDIGKATSLKKLKSSKPFQKVAKIFAVEPASPKDICAAGKQALVYAYNGMTGESLDTLCYKRFFEKVATNTVCIHPQTFPPTSAAAKYHSLHVY